MGVYEFSKDGTIIRNT